MDTVELVACGDPRRAEALIRRNMAVDYRRHGLDWDDDAFRREWPRLTWCWLVRHDRRCGLMGWQLRHGILYLHELQVCEGERGKGVGAQALALVEAQARRDDCVAVRLRVLSGSRAEALYRRQGYRKLREDPTPRGSIFGLEKRL
ncbi:GNAT family N-acetyltransferase [Halomonas sp. V046]|uniref:GNAT family N-acetyltransferase n=1 Tax=Halomonas sp. V046 TaxID=3459611 RepID=UPI004044B275